MRILIWSSVLLLLAGALYLFFGRKEESKARPAAQITITTATAQKGNIGVYLDAIGTVTPVYTVSMFSQVTFPSATIQQNGQTSFVYVIEENVAHLQNIKVGVTDNGLTQGVRLELPKLLQLLSYISFRRVEQRAPKGHAFQASFRLGEVNPDTLT